MSGKEDVHEMLRRALDADEQGDKLLAVDLYSNAVEMILKITDPTLREKLNKYAVNAIERAEELRGISPTHKPKLPQQQNVPNPSTSLQQDPSQMQSTFVNIFASNWKLIY